MNIDDIIRQIADMNGVSEDEVKAELEKTIQASAENPSPKFKEAFGDRVPSIDEFLDVMAGEITKRTAN